MGATQDIARFVVETDVEALPERLMHEGKRCLINYLAVSLYASTDPSLNILLDVFREEGGNASASVVGAEARTSMQNAALANGYLAHLDDYDDTHFPTIIHPSAPTFPAALAVAEASRRRWTQRAGGIGAGHGDYVSHRHGRSPRPLRRGLAHHRHLRRIRRGRRLG